MEEHHVALDRIPKRMREHGQAADVSREPFWVPSAGPGVSVTTKKRE